MGVKKLEWKRTVVPLDDNSYSFAGAMSHEANVSTGSVLVDGLDLLSFVYCKADRGEVPLFINPQTQAVRKPPFLLNKYIGLPSSLVGIGRSSSDFHNVTASTGPRKYQNLCTLASHSGQSHAEVFIDGVSLLRQYCGEFQEGFRLYSAHPSEGLTRAPLFPMLKYEGYL